MHVAQASLLMATVTGGAMWVHHLLSTTQPGRITSVFPWG